MTILERLLLHSPVDFTVRVEAEHIEFPVLDRQVVFLEFAQLCLKETLQLLLRQTCCRTAIIEIGDV